MIAIDTNILVYARRVETPHHATARKLLHTLAEGGRPWVLPWPCVYEYLRVVTHPRVFDPPTGIEAALTDLESLFDLVDRGGKRYAVPAYNGGLFDDEENLFLSEKVLSDWHLARVIDQLSRAVDEQNPDAGLSRVDYGICGARRHPLFSTHSCNTAGNREAEASQKSKGKIGHGSASREGRVTLVRRVMFTFSVVNCFDSRCYELSCMLPPNEECYLVLNHAQN